MPDVTLDRLTALWPDLKGLTPHVRTALEADALYAGYTDRQRREIERFREDDREAIPADLDYHSLPGLSMELRQKLTRVRPATVGQALRVDGMTPAALTCVLAGITKLAARKAG